MSAAILQGCPATTLDTDRGDFNEYTETTTSVSEGRKSSEK
jgi:hypothetical protein